MPKNIEKWHSRPKNGGYAICAQEYVLQSCRFFSAPQDLAVKSYIIQFALPYFFSNRIVWETILSTQSPNSFSSVAAGPE